MSSIRGDKDEKAVFVIVNVALVIVWTRFLIRLITRWNVMEPNVRGHVGLFMLFISLLWLTLIRERRSYISVLMVGAVLMTVIEIVRMFT